MRINVILAGVIVILGIFCALAYRQTKSDIQRLLDSRAVQNIQTMVEEQSEEVVDETE